ncbi:Fucose permease [Caloramator fervidus]|uniref:Fucose permease n=1 Tax=Caloramator fervidus TaxID=29344 RepID=A0A1H5U9N9_9CLOT|nr:MFS transporter [Caloramator fervidus]SEF71699.1 Fucose permease [Caloramator fervidus]
MKKHVFTITYLFIIMFFIGFSENTRGIFIPLFKNEFKVSNSIIGVMLIVSSLGYVIFQYIGGMLIEKYGYKKIYFISLLLNVIAFLGLGKSINFYMLLMSMFVFNAAISLFSIATNSLVPILFISYQAILMNLTHFFYGFGTSIGQRSVGILLKKGFGWRDVYLGLSVVFAILTIIFFLVNFPYVGFSKGRQKINFKDIIKDKRVVFFILALGFYVFSEISVANWFANFMITSYSLDSLKASYYLSMFFLIFTVGRLVGGFIVERFGYFNSLITFFPTAIVLFTLGLLFGKKYLFLISLSGFFFSIGFPTIVLIVNNTFKENKTYILGIIIALTLTINMILNFIVGVLNDLIGAYYTFYLVPSSLLLSLIFILYIKHKVYKGN